MINSDVIGAAEGLGRRMEKERNSGGKSRRKKKRIVGRLEGPV